MAEEIERVFIIPLKKNGLKNSKSAPTAVKRVKNYLTHHMKVEEKDIWIDDSLNNALWSKGKFSIPSKIRVKAVKFDDGVVEAYLPELEFKKSRRELLKEEREKKEPILRKEEMEAEGEGEGAGADDYEIAPTGDGEVKIKKKKAPREKSEDKKTGGKKPSKSKKKEEDTKKKGKKDSKKEESEGKEPPVSKRKKTSTSSSKKKSGGSSKKSKGKNKSSKSEK